MTGAWIGVDFDGTLSEYHHWRGPGVYGPPIPRMLERVKAWLATGVEVRIVTARAVDPEDAKGVEEWLAEHGLPGLVVTDRKDFGMVELWDDRAVTVEHNTGRSLVARRA